MRGVRCPYERTLFNLMLGTQDPDSPHGFNCYYTGLSPGAFKQQPLNYFPHGDPHVYATDYGDFTCDHATGLETQAKFPDTIYSRDARAHHQHYTAYWNTVQPHGPAATAPPAGQLSPG